MKKKTANLRQVFLIPLLLGVLTAIGLISALLGDGGWDAIAWLGLGLPVLLSARGLLWRGKKPD